MKVLKGLVGTVVLAGGALMAIHSHDEVTSWFFAASTFVVFVVVVLYPTSDNLSWYSDARKVQRRMREDRSVALKG